MRAAARGAPRPWRAARSPATHAYRRTLDDLGALALAQPDLHIVPSHCAASIAALRDDCLSTVAPSAKVGLSTVAPSAKVDLSTVAPSAKVEIADAALGAHRQ